MLPAGSLGTKLHKCEISNVFIKHSQIPVGVSKMSYSHLHSALSLQDAEGTCGHTHGHAHTCTHTVMHTHTNIRVHAHGTAPSPATRVLPCCSSTAECKEYKAKAFPATLCPYCHAQPPGNVFAKDAAKNASEKSGSGLEIRAG